MSNAPVFHAFDLRIVDKDTVARPKRDLRDGTPTGDARCTGWARLTAVYQTPQFQCENPRRNGVLRFVLDFVLWNAPARRFGERPGHVYAILWYFGVAATMRLRPHRCDADRVRLRFGCIRRLDVSRDNIASVTLRGTIADSAALRRERGTLSLIRSGVPTVELMLREPVVVQSLRGARAVHRVLVPQTSRRRSPRHSQRSARTRASARGTPTTVR